jgi:hypothetical protein
MYNYLSRMQSRLKMKIKATVVSNLPGKQTRCGGVVPTTCCVSVFRCLLGQDWSFIIIRSYLHLLIAGGCCTYRNEINKNAWYQYTYGCNHPSFHHKRHITRGRPIHSSRYIAVTKAAVTIRVLRLYMMYELHHITKSL